MNSYVSLDDKEILKFESMRQPYEDRKEAILNPFKNVIIKKRIKEHSYLVVN